MNIIVAVFGQLFIWEFWEVPWPRLTMIGITDFVRLWYYFLEQSVADPGDLRSDLSPLLNFKGKPIAVLLGKYQSLESLRTWSIWLTTSFDAFKVLLRMFLGEKKMLPTFYQLQSWLAYNHRLWIYALFFFALKVHTSFLYMSRRMSFPPYFRSWRARVSSSCSFLVFLVNGPSMSSVV